MLRRCFHPGNIRIADVSINTVTKLLVDAGQVCSKHQVVGVKAKPVQADEILELHIREEKFEGADFQPEKCRLRVLLLNIDLSTICHR
jgi:hypothetical protein